MKELSIEDKAKAYDEAIKRVEDIVGGKCPKPFMFTEGLFDYIFPELKESEDEKIRKELIENFKWFCGDEPETTKWGKDDNLLVKDIIAWLEKQGKSALEAIKEEKVDNANKVEPQDEFTKFERAVKQVMEEAIECGDTHNLKADADMLLSLIQKPDEEYNITGIHSKHAEGKLGKMIKNLKTINEKQGEKPRYSIGDVLCDKSCTTLNKDAQPNFEIVTIKDGLYICDKGYIPISQQDEYELVAKKIEQNPAWSEEDEAHIMAIDLAVNRCLGKWHCCGEKCPISEHNPWLKCLKERVLPQNTWKPSDEQLKAQKRE